MPPLISTCIPFLSLDKHNFINEIEIRQHLKKILRRFARAAFGLHRFAFEKSRVDEF